MGLVLSLVSAPIPTEDWLFPFLIGVVVIALSIISLFIPIIGLGGVALSLGVVIYQVLNATSDIVRMFSLIVMFISAMCLYIGRNR